MSEQRTVHTLDGKSHTITNEEQKAANEAARKLRADKRARFVRVLERGYTVDRMHVDLPADLHGEWVPVDQVDRWETLGFMIDKTHAPQRQLHAQGDGSAHIGDTVFMTCSKEDYDLMQEIKHEMFVMMHGSPDEKKRLQQKEEKEFTSVVEQSVGLPVIDESVERQVHKSEIKEALTPAVPSLQDMRKK